MSQMQAGSSQKFKGHRWDVTQDSSRQTDDARVRWGGDRGGRGSEWGGAGGKLTIFSLSFLLGCCVCVWYVECVCVTGHRVDRYPTCLDLLSVWSVWLPCTAAAAAAAAIPRRQDKRRDKTGVGVGEGEGGRGRRVHDMMSFSFSQGSFFSFAACLVSGAGDIYHDVSGVGQARGRGGVASGHGGGGGGIPPFGILHDCFFGDERCYGILATRDDKAFLYGIG